MRYIKAFLESDDSGKSNDSVNIEDYFIDLTDSGFIMSKDLNNYKFKYKGTHNVDDVLLSYQDVLDKLRHFKGVTKSSFSFSEDLVNMNFEIRDKNDIITVKVKGVDVELTPYAYNIITESPNGRDILLYYVGILCKDSENRRRTLIWRRVRNSILDYGNNRMEVSCSGTKMIVNLETAKEIIELVKSGKLKMSRDCDRGARLRSVLNRLEPKHLANS